MTDHAALRRALPAVQGRFWVKVHFAPMNECWNWKGAKDHLGYGRFNIGGRTYLSHRIAYFSRFGVISSDLVIDHLCRNPSCCNFSHMQEVTLTENTRRGVGIAPWYAARTHCNQGHEFNEQNTTYNAKGWRSCKVCNRERVRAYNAAKKATA